jgi:hypothetical protein
MEGHSSRPEQVEDRISELKDKIEIKEKAEEILVKQLKRCKRKCKSSATPPKDQTWSGRVGQLVGHLPSKCKALSSNPMLPKTDQT